MTGMQIRSMLSDDPHVASPPTWQFYILTVCLHRHEIYEILDDLSNAYILHCDLRPVNIVRAPKSTEVCEQHKRVHKWNLIDFAWSTVDERDPVPGLRLETIQRHQRVPYRTVYFCTGR